MKRVTSLLMIFVLTTGSMSAFIPDRACKYACCQRDMDCCVGNNKMENCSLSAVTDISSLNLIASGPKPPKCRQDADHHISDLVIIPEKKVETSLFHSSDPGNLKVPLYYSYRSLLI